MNISPGGPAILKIVDWVSASASNSIVRFLFALIWGVFAERYKSLLALIFPLTFKLVKVPAPAVKAPPIVKVEVLLPLIFPEAVMFPITLTLFVYSYC